MVNNKQLVFNEAVKKLRQYIKKMYSASYVININKTYNDVVVTIQSGVEEAFIVKPVVNYVCNSNTNDNLTQPMNEIVRDIYSVMDDLYDDDNHLKVIIDMNYSVISQSDTQANYKKELLKHCSIKSYNDTLVSSNKKSYKLACVVYNLIHNDLDKYRELFLRHDNVIDEHFTDLFIDKKMYESLLSRDPSHLSFCISYDMGDKTTNGVIHYIHFDNDKVYIDTTLLRDDLSDLMDIIEDLLN